MIALLCLAAALAVPAAPDGDAAAAAPTGDAGSAAPELAVVDDAELAEQRAGFRVGQLDIRLGADIRSYLDGNLVMRTTVSWTDVAGGAQQVVTAGLSPAVADEMASRLMSDAGLTLNVGADKVVFANGGQTAFVQRTDGTIQNMIVNTASNVALRQDADIRLDVAGYAPFRADVVGARVGAALSEMSRAALAQGRPN